MKIITFRLYADVSSILVVRQFVRSNSGSYLTLYTHVCQHRDDGRALNAIHICLEWSHGLHYHLGRIFRNAARSHS